MKRLVSLSLLVLAALSASAVTNDLVITSITRQNNCTSLTWNSHPGEFYTVQWTDNLTPPIFWRVAEVNVPSQGTNTIWWEGGCSQTLMAGGGEGESSGSEPAESDDTKPADEKPTVDEPTLGGINDPKTLFGLWFVGKSFAISAWQSVGKTQIGYTGIYTVMNQATGDPLVAK